MVSRGTNTPIAKRRAMEYVEDLDELSQRQRIEATVMEIINLAHDIAHQNRMEIKEHSFELVSERDESVVLATVQESEDGQVHIHYC